MILCVIDIETTGLDRGKDQILEIGAVIEDTNKELSFDDIPKYKAIINHKRISGSLYALNMNARIIEILANIPKKGIKKQEYLIKHNIIKPEDFQLSFHTFLTSNGYSENDDGQIKLITAGKNFSSFDKPFLENHINNYSRLFPLFDFGHRAIDPANMFIDFKNDTEIPSLNVCLKKAGIDELITHNALIDAWDVIRVLRKKY